MLTITQPRETRKQDEDPGLPAPGPDCCSAVHAAILCESVLVILRYEGGNRDWTPGVSELESIDCESSLKKGEPEVYGHLIK